MKKLMILICSVSILLVLTACGDGTDDASSDIKDEISQTIEGENIELPEGSEEPSLDKTNEPFPGKIAFITGSIASQPDYEYYAAARTVEKYGEDKIVHVEWPREWLDGSMMQSDPIKELVKELGEDPEIKAIITIYPLYGASEAFELLRQEREDIFVVFVLPHENLSICEKAADICIELDYLGMGSAMVEQARKLGAETFVHYSFPRHLSNAILAERRNLIEETCESLGIRFIDVSAPDPASEAGLNGLHQFILNSVSMMVEQYGEGTAFFAISCTAQIPLVDAVIESSAILPQTCCTYPKHGFVGALGIPPGWEYENDPVTGDDIIIAAITRELAEKDMLGRMSCWPENYVFAITYPCVEYVVSYLNGEVPREVEAEVLRQMMIERVGTEVYLTPYVDEYPYTENGTGDTFDNAFLLRMDYITFE